MKYVLVAVLLFVSTITIAQTPATSQPVLVAYSLSQLTGYTGTQQQANWVDAIRGGKLNLVDTAGLVVDNGIVFASAKGNKYWKRDMSQVQVIKAEWYDLKDDGTDQSSLLNSIISAIPDNSTLALPISKTYNTASVWRLTKPVKIIGNGSTLNYDGTDSNIVSIQSSFVTIDGLKLIGNSTTYTSYRNSISTAGNSNTSFYDGITITHCVISGYKFCGILGKYITNFSITDNTVTDFPYAGVMVISATHGVISGNKISHITGLGSSGNNAYGIAMTRVNANVDDTLSHDIVVTGNEVSDVPTWEGIDTHSGYNLVISNNIIRDTRSGILVGNVGIPGDAPATNITITGNVINNEATMGANGYSILVQGSSAAGYATATVVGNVCIGSKIQLQWTRGVTITGNVLKRVPNQGIRQNGRNFNTVIVGNSFEDILGVNGAAVFQFSDSNNAFIANNSLVRGDRDTSGYGKINHYGFRDGITNPTNSAVFGLNDFTAATTQYFGTNDPIYLIGSGTPTYTAVGGSVYFNKSGAAGNTLYLRDTVGWKPYNNWNSLPNIPNLLYPDGVAGGQAFTGGTNSGDGFTLYTNSSHNGDFIFGNSRYRETANQLIIGSSTIAAATIVGGTHAQMQAITTTGTAAISAYMNDGTDNYRAALWVDGANRKWGLSNQRSSTNRDTFVIKEFDGEIFRAIISGSTIKRAGLFVSTPTARLQLPSGSSGVNSAPLKLADYDTRPGVNTTAEKFAVEVDSSATGGDLYYTNAIGVRRKVEFVGYVAKTATYTAAVTDNTIDCTSGTFTVTLPTAVGMAGKTYRIVNSGSGTITIATTSSEVFSNITSTPTSLTLSPVGAAAIVSYTLQSTGTKWMVVAKVKNE